MATKILTSDILIVDRVIDLRRRDLTQDQKQAVQELQKRFQFPLSGKKEIPKTSNEKEVGLEEALGILQEKGITTNDVAGGSSANTVITLQKTLGSDKVSTKFLGVVGTTDQDKLITDGLAGAGIERLPKNFAEGLPDPESATSLVIVDEKGQRNIATYKGNAHELLKSEWMNGHLFDEYNTQDAVLVQGSLWYKYGSTKPVENGHETDVNKLGVADRMLHERRARGMELWLTMPTTADFSKNITDADGKPLHVSHEDRAKLFRDLVKDANVVMGNGEEISRVYTTEDERKKIATIIEKGNQATDEEKARYDLKNRSVKVEVALARLKEDLDKKQLEKDSKWHGNKSQVAFVTLGKEGAVVIEAGKEDIDYVPTAAFDDKNIVNTLGAGDASYAGFLAAYQLKKEHPDITYKDCATMGMWMAREKLKEHGARVSNPCEAMRQTIQEKFSCPIERSMARIFNAAFLGNTSALRMISAKRNTQGYFSAP